MTVQTSSDTGQAPGAATPGQGQAPTGPQDQQHGQQGDQQQTGQAPGAQGAPFDFTTVQDPALRAYLERQDAELRRARDDAAKYRTTAAEREQQVQQFQRQNETAEQAAQREAQERAAELDTLRAQVRDLQVGGAVQTAASTAGALNPQTVWDLVQARKMPLEVDAQGQPTNVEAVLAALKASDPYLFRQALTGADGGAGGGGGSAPAAGGINAMLRGQATRPAR